MDNITLGALFSDLQYSVSYQQVEHIGIKPAPQSSSDAATAAPNTRLSTTTSSNLSDSTQAAPITVDNAGSSSIDDLATSLQNAQTAKTKQPRRFPADEYPRNGDGSSFVSVVIPSTPSIPSSTRPRTRSQSRKRRNTEDFYFSNDESPSGSPSSPDQDLALPSSPPSSPPSSQLCKDVTAGEACPVCKKPGELFQLKGQGFVWCDTHFKQTPVARPLASQNPNFLKSRDDHNKKTPKKRSPKSKVPVSVAIVTQLPSNKIPKGHNGGKSSKKRECDLREYKRKRRHVTEEEDSASEST